MGRFSPTVLPQYYPGIGEGLAHALGDIGSAIAQRRTTDRQNASADALQRFTLNMQGFRTGDLPTDATATGTDATTGQSRALSPEEAAQAQADLVSGARQNRLAADKTGAATGESLRRFAAGAGSSIPGAASVATTPVPQRPMGAFDPTQVKFDYTPRAGIIDMGDVTVGRSRGAKPEHWYYDPSQSPEGLRLSSEQALASFRAMQEATLAAMRERGEDTRFYAGQEGEDRRTAARMTTEAELARMREQAENSRTEFTTRHADARSADTRDAASNDRDARRQQAEEDAMWREAQALAQHIGPYYGKLDEAYQSVAAAHARAKAQGIPLGPDGTVTPPTTPPWGPGGTAPQAQMPNPADVDARYRALYQKKKAAGATPAELQHVVDSWKADLSDLQKAQSGARRAPVNPFTVTPFTPR